MANIRQVQKSQPNFNDVMAIAQDAIMARLNCHNIGRVIEFDSATQTCTVELMQIKQFNKQTFIPAPITQVPLIILGAGGGHITMPNPVGTICLLLFLDRNIDNFMETGEQYVPETARMHDFTDCVALTTFTTLANPLQDYDEEAITIFNQAVVEEVEQISYIKIYPNKIQIETAEEANITLTDTISISNSNQNLADLIQQLISAITSIMIGEPPFSYGLSADSIALLNTVAEKFKELLPPPEEET